MCYSRLPRFFVCLFSVLALLLIAEPAQSQEVTAGINGTVTDPSGAAVAGVKVTAKDLDRGTVFPTTTGGDGHYNLPRVPIGNYEVRAEDPGFQVAVPWKHFKLKPSGCKDGKRQQRETQHQLAGVLSNCCLVHILCGSSSKAF